MSNYVQQATTLLAERLPDCDADLLALYALLALTLGEETQLRDVHDAWAVWRNATNPAHKSLVPFVVLTPEVQELDRKYMDAIREVGRMVAPHV